MKLEVKHLAPYLPYGLKLHVQGEVMEDERPILFNMVGIVDEEVLVHRINYIANVENEIEDCIPILRPLNLLSKHDIDFMYFQIISTDNDMYGNRMEFDDYFSETDINHLPICLYNYLLENHFDVFGLIDNKLAIDISTIS